MSSSKLLTTETARVAVEKITQFLADEREGTKNVLFRRNVFDPIWQLLKVQTIGVAKPTDSQGSLNWRMVPSSKLPLMRSFVYVPSGGSSAGVDGADYHSSEESVILALLEEIIAEPQGRTSRQRPVEAGQAESLAGMAAILRAAVDGGLDYEAVRDGRKDSKTRPSRSSIKRNYVEDFLSGLENEDEVIEYERPRKKRARVEADDPDDTDGKADGKEEGLPESNLSGVEPKVNMPLEILDEGIWNYGRIIKIIPKSKPSSGPTTYRVTVRCEGWNGSNWDRTIDYPDGRLARIFTYTKRVKGIVELVPPSGAAADNTGPAAAATDWTRTWPCRVYFRMPNPGCDVAVSLLESEDSILVQPYLPELLPVCAREKISGGYLWVTSSALRPWKELDVTGPRSISNGGELIIAEQTTRLDHASDEEYRVKLNFCRAYQQAESDWIQPMPSDPLSVGSLVKPKYCVHNLGGDVIDGVRFSGSFPSHDGGLAPSGTSPEIDIEPRARQLEHSRKFASILRTGASEIVLGTYFTEEEAVDAATTALSCDDSGICIEGEVNARGFNLVELLSSQREMLFVSPGTSLTNGTRMDWKSKRKGTPRRRMTGKSNECASKFN